MRSGAILRIVLAGFVVGTCFACNMGGPGSQAQQAISATGDEMSFEVDLRIGIAGEGADVALGHVLSVATDQSGRIYVLDGSVFGVHVFESDGEFVQLIGGTFGTGPGDFDRRGAMAIVADRLVYSRPGRVSIWTLDGQLVADTLPAVSPTITPLGATPDGEMYATYRDRDPSGRRSWVLAVLTLRGELVRVLATYETEPPRYFRRPGLLVNASAPLFRPTAVVSPKGAVYVAASSGYEVLALAANGRREWSAARPSALRVPLEESQRARLLARVRKRIPDAQADEIEWPVSFPALDSRSYGRGRGIQTDGEGNLYVFPYAKAEPSRERPVDVYSSTGQFLFNADVPTVDWIAWHDEYVFSIEESAATLEPYLARWRVTRR